MVFLKLYDTVIENIAIFPSGFDTTDIEYRGYVIHIFPFGNYNLFYTVDGESRRIFILRVLYQKQNWHRILRVENTYHIRGKN